MMIAEVIWAYMIGVRCLCFYMTQVGILGGLLVIKHRKAFKWARMTMHDRHHDEDHDGHGPWGKKKKKGKKGKKGHGYGSGSESETMNVSDIPESYK